ncbi:MAG: aspartyl protease family protein [Pirellulales bacterium]
MVNRTRAARFLLLACALVAPRSAHATGVPVAGYDPFVGISLTDKFKNENADIFFQADLEASLVGSQFGSGGTPHYDLALLDSGAATSLVTAASDAAFDIQGAGFRGTVSLTIGGATGFLEATINDPMAIFATGLGNRTGTSPLALNTSTFVGQSSVSLITIPPESDLPNVLGIPFVSQYATYVRNDQPQIFTLNGRTVRTPQIELLPLGSGGQGIVRRAPMQLQSATAFATPPLYIFNFDNIINGDPLTDNPQTPTVLQEPAAFYLNISAQNDGQSLSNFLFAFDTGADVTVVSELNAVRLGFDPVLDEPDFTVAVVGSGGINLEVPGFFADQFTIQAIAGSITLDNVPIVVLDVPDPGNPGNIVDGIVGTNLLAGRNVVIDPKPALGGGGVGPSLYISDPVTTQKTWTATAASGTWATGSNWSGGTAPTTLSVTDVRHVTGGDQKAILASDATVWELNVSGDVGQSMTVRVENGARLTSFAGMNVESGGTLEVAGGIIDAQFVEVFGGTLRGAGLITTGSGPIPGQVENRGGTVAPGDGVGKLEIDGRFASSIDSTLAIDLGGLTAVTQYDQLVVDGGVALAGTLAVSLVNLGGGPFVPSVGNAFTIITATDGISGSFDALIAPSGYNWGIAYGPTSVTLSVGTPGDYNDNGVVDAADYTIWQDSVGANGSNLPADGDGDGSIDTDDYAVWKNHFGQSAGAGGGAGSAAVPEPSGLLLMLLAAIVGELVFARRPLATAGLRLAV